MPRCRSSIGGTRSRKRNVPPVNSRVNSQALQELADIVDWRQIEQVLRERLFLALDGYLEAAAFPDD